MRLMKDESVLIHFPGRKNMRYDEIKKFFMTCGLYDLYDHSYVESFLKNKSRYRYRLL